MNENVMAIISQSVSTTVMNLLLFLFYRRIYEPKFQNKTVYIFTFIATTALFITINQISNFLSAPLINTIYSFVYFNLASVVLFKCKLKKHLCIIRYIFCSWCSLMCLVLRFGL